MRSGGIGQVVTARQRWLASGMAALILAWGTSACGTSAWAQSPAAGDKDQQADLAARELDKKIIAMAAKGSEVMTNLTYLTRQRRFVGQSFQADVACPISVNVGKPVRLESLTYAKPHDGALSN